MTDERGREPAADRSPPANPVAPAPQEGPPQALSESPPRRAGAARLVAACLAAVLVILIAGVILSPFWAPAVMPLLPWGARAAVTHQDVAALAARVTVLEERPAAPVVDVGALKSTQAALAHRLDGMEATIDGLRRNQAASAEAKQAVAQLAQRLDASDAKSASRAAAAGADIVTVQRQLSQLGGLATDQGTRLTALERQVQAQSGVDRNGAMLLMALLQMREAVEQARPFPADYDAFKRLAGNDAKLVAAVQPLAKAARDGVASRIDLSRRLATLSTQVSAPARPAATSSSWWAQALDRMRQLVTIRRIDAAAKTGPEAAVGGAQQALARGDLAAAVSALNGLTGTNAEAARPWLETARERLAAEAALTQLQGMLVARLGTEPAPAPAMG
ncbi:MAG: COG4223 family protein, partial [Stellaceae bacterium]